MDDTFGPESDSLDATAFEQWVDRIAESRGIAEEEVLQQLASSLWVLDELETLMDETDLHGELPPGESSGESGDGRSTLGDEVAALDEQVAALSEAVEGVETRVGDLERDTREDLDHVEEVLRYLVERSDDLAERASAVEERLDAATTAVAELERERAALASLQATANDHGVTKAECERCGGTVRLATLVTPACPTCDAPFDALSPKSSWFGTNRLLTAADPRDAAGRAAERTDELLRGADADSNEDGPANRDADATVDGMADADATVDGTADGDATADETLGDGDRAADTSEFEWETNG